MVFDSKAYDRERKRILRQNPDYRAKEAEQKKAYNQTPAGKKSITISKWKQYGLIDSDGDKYEKRYQSYLQATNCEVCKNVFKDTFDKCLDHNHETGLFRQFLCRSCNSFDRWLKHERVVSHQS